MTALVVSVLTMGQLAGSSYLELRGTIERSLPYLDREAQVWIEQRGCVSCHRVSLSIWAHGEARNRGFEVDDAKVRSMTDWAFVNMLAEREEYGGADTISQMLLGSDRESTWRKKPPRHFKTVDPYETLFEILLQRQKDDGSWPPEGQLSTPPELTTGWALLALESRRDLRGAAAEGLDPDRDLGDELANQLSTIEQKLPNSRVRALEYLRKVEPHGTHEGLVLRAMLATIDGEHPKGVAKGTLIAAQRADGGWSNRADAAESDAFATGQSLYALSRIGDAADQLAIQRARAFLIQTQRADGSWRVPADWVRDGARSESLDEVFSYWGTAWASIGLLRTMPPFHQLPSAARH